jgi:hypothetical protein
MLLSLSIFWRLSNFYLNKVEAHDIILANVKTDIDRLERFAVIVKAAERSITVERDKATERELDSLDLSPSYTKDRRPSKSAAEGPISLSKKLMVQAKNLAGSTKVAQGGD